MGRRRPDWWSEQQQDRLDDGCPRNAANARERARMRVLSKAFSRLKTTLPWVPADTKLSKLDTLRLATTYIAHLSSLLTSPDPVEQTDVVTVDSALTATATVVHSSQPPPNYTVTWPYNVHNGVNEYSSPEDNCRFARYTTLEQKSYSSYDSLYTSINS